MTKTIAKLNRRIAARNKAFAKLTPAKKRVRIAKDVLEQLDAKRIKAKPGTYLWATGNKLKVTEKDLGKDLSELTTQIKSCDACAIGSLFLCAVERADALKIGEAYSNSEAEVSYTSDKFNDMSLSQHIYLRRFFPRGTLDSMEATFEKYDIWGEGRQLRVPAEQRLRLIMENVIRNKGEFIYDDPVMLKVGKARD
jgi:hypothetical protein